MTVEYAYCLLQHANPDIIYLGLLSASTGSQLVADF
jgi:hypothetical protein